jgi:hypothetical protein
VALDWENRAAPLTTPSSDSARFLLAGAERAFWLRTKQGYLAEGMPLLRQALAALREGTRSGGDAQNVIIESNSLLQFVKPSLYVTVLDQARHDFKDSARQMLGRSDVLVFRRGLDADDAAHPPWLKLPARLLREAPSLLQREGEPVPEPLVRLVKRILEAPPGISV